jgi:hypothetical protein
MLKIMRMTTLKVRCLRVWKCKKKLLENWADEQGLDYRILDSTELAHPVEPSPWSQSADPKNVADKPISCSDSFIKGNIS